MNGGNLQKSDRLKKVYMAIEAAGPEGITTMQLVENAICVNPGCAVSKINDWFGKNGYAHRIVCAFERTTETRRRVFRYRLLTGIVRRAS